MDKCLMVVSPDSIRVQHLVEVCGLSLTGGIEVITPTTFSGLCVKLAMASSGLALLLASSPSCDSSGLTMLTVATPRPRGCSVSCCCV